LGIPENNWVYTTIAAYLGGFLFPLSNLL